MEYRKISLEELDKLKNLYAYENFEEFKKLIINDISKKPNYMGFFDKLGYLKRVAIT